MADKARDLYHRLRIESRLQVAAGRDGVGALLYEAADFIVNSPAPKLVGPSEPARLLYGSAAQEQYLDDRITALAEQVAALTERLGAHHPLDRINALEGWKHAVDPQIKYAADVAERVDALEEWRNFRRELDA